MTIISSRVKAQVKLAIGTYIDLVVVCVVSVVVDM